MYMYIIISLYVYVFVYALCAAGRHPRPVACSPPYHIGACLHSLVCRLRVLSVWLAKFNEVHVRYLNHYSQPAAEYVVDRSTAPCGGCRGCHVSASKQPGQAAQLSRPSDGFSAYIHPGWSRGRLGAGRLTGIAWVRASASLRLCVSASLRLCVSAMYATYAISVASL